VIVLDAWDFAKLKSGAIAIPFDWTFRSEEATSSTVGSLGGMEGKAFINVEGASAGFGVIFSAGFEVLETIRMLSTTLGFGLCKNEVT
jgi:hypothetical protein